VCDTGTERQIHPWIKTEWEEMGWNEGVQKQTFENQFKRNNFIYFFLF
jgi:hypothetical protein